LSLPAYTSSGKTDIHREKEWPLCNGMEVKEREETETQKDTKVAESKIVSKEIKNKTGMRQNTVQVYVQLYI
jgi:hypothetical protein